jgi:hypothetical protein
VASHVQNIGWQPGTSSANTIGTTGLGLRLEAFEIKLTGEIGNHYRIYYRAHVQDVGWQTWVADGGTAGTSGMGKRLEAVEIPWARPTWWWWWPGQPERLHHAVRARRTSTWAGSKPTRATRTMRSGPRRCWATTAPPVSGVRVSLCPSPQPS